MTAKRKRWAIQVIDDEGNVIYLRRGRVPGAGPIVTFHSKRDAEINVEMVSAGMDEGWHVSVINAEGLST